MSEEPPPPSSALRLKPRLRPAESPASGTAVTGETPLVAAEPTVPAVPNPPDAPLAKIRLRPKLEAAPASQSATASAEPIVPAADGVVPAVVAAPAPPPLFIADPPAAAPAPVANPAEGAATGESRTFKLKPKAAPSAATAVAPSAPPVPPPPPPPPPLPPGLSRSPIPIGAAPKTETGKTPPPFPVVAQARPRTTSAPIPVPHVRLKSEVLQPEVEPTVPAPASARREMRSVVMGLVALALLGGGGFFAWKHFFATPPAAAPAPPSAPKAAAPKPAAPSPATDTLNQIAHAPVNAINKAQDALAARRASGQNRVDAAAAGEDQPARPVAPPKPELNTTTAKKALAPGLSATTTVEAAANASPEFLTYIANLKVSGVFQGNPARAVINGKLTREGETVEPRLGIVFDGVDGPQHQLVFKDRTGATVSRKF